VGGLRDSQEKQRRNQQMIHSVESSRAERLVNYYVKCCSPFLEVLSSGKTGPFQGRWAQRGLKTWLECCWQR
jgi:hypothetical protein